MQTSSYQVVAVVILFIACVSQLFATKVTNKPNVDKNPPIRIHLGNSTRNTTFKLWPNAVVYYEKSQYIDNGTEWKAITDAMEQFHKSTCVRFVEHKKEPNYIFIDNVNPTNPQDYCGATIGMIGGNQYMTLGKTCPEVWGGVHELMHSIGFFHEHQRKNRDQFVNIYWDNISARRDYDIYRDADYLENLNVPYDISSIMHYNGWDRKRVE